MIEVAVISITIGALCAFLHAPVWVFIAVNTIVFLGIVFTYESLRSVVYAAVVVCCIVAGSYMYQIEVRELPYELFAQTSLTGRIVSVDRRFETVHLVIKDNVSMQKVLVISTDTAYLPGDLITVQGTIAQPEGFITSDGKFFDYPLYLKSRNIIAVLRQPEIELLTSGDISLERGAASIRFYLSRQIAKFVTVPIDGIVSGMLMGYKGNIPTDTEALFRNTGVLHVLVLSGYNITLLAGAIGTVLRNVSLRYRSVITVCSIIFLVLISGTGIAAMRAGIMGIISIYALQVRKPYSALRALFVSYLIFFFISPLTIFSDPGFHLSFLATVFMIAGIPVVLPYFTWVSTRFNLREIVALAISVPLFMLPYSIYFSGTFPFASIPANVLLSIIGPVFMVVGVCILLLSFLPPLSIMLGVAMGVVGLGMLHVLEFFSRLPKLHSPPIAWWGIVLIYIAGFYFLFRQHVNEYRLHLRKTLLPLSSSSAA